MLETKNIKLLILNINKCEKLNLIRYGSCLLGKGREAWLDK